MTHIYVVLTFLFSVYENDFDSTININNNKFISVLIKLMSFPVSNAPNLDVSQHSFKVRGYE